MTPEQYAELAIAYQEAMDSDYSFPGKHQVLIGVLNKLGYNIRSFEEAYALAEELLYGRDRPTEDRNGD